ncbi:MAG: metallophosphoesterase [Clostridiales bacterium]|nr:metallophosphoesterase [Clostridiales bacterium]
MKRKGTQICALLLAGMLLLTACASNTASRGGAESFSGAEGSTSASAPAEPSSSAETEPVSAESSVEAEAETMSAESSAEVEAEPELLATLFFASDYQYKEGWPQPAETLSSLLDAVSSAGYQLDNAILCGDYTYLKGLSNYEASPEESIAEIKSIFTAYDPDWDAEDMVFVQGNHDALTESLNETGLYEYEDYLVYVLDTQYDFPWKQGALGLEETVQNAAAEMEACFDELIADGETRPVIIAGHVPLHYSGRTSSQQGTGDNLYSSYIFNVVNDAATELDCIYLFGHNHSKGWDSYMGGSCVYRAVGDSLLLPAFSEGAVATDTFSVETLNFTYLNAGYLGYFSDSGAADTLTCTICEIYEDEIVLTRCSVDGVCELSADGAANPYSDDTGLISSDYYGTALPSPQVIARKS